MTGNRIKRKLNPIELKRIEINSIEKKPNSKKESKLIERKNNQRKEMKTNENNRNQ